MEIDHRFSMDYYEKFIQKCKTALRVMDYKLNKTGLILRHDVDFSIDLAYEFSQAEKRNLITSTYYILLTSELYNPLSFSNLEKIKAMINDGFEIGLHFDPSIYGNVDIMTLEGCFLNEIFLFEKTFNTKVHSYSLHNPSIHGKYPIFHGFINAYNNEIFSDETYISDSMFSFRGKDPIEFLEKSKHQLVQFLTHPIHYFSNGKLSYENSINIIINKYYRKFDSILDVNKAYKNERIELKVNIKPLN